MEMDFQHGMCLLLIDRGYFIYCKVRKARVIWVS